MKAAGRRGAEDICLTREPLKVENMPDTSEVGTQCKVAESCMTEADRAESLTSPFLCCAAWQANLVQVAITTYCRLLDLTE